MASIKQMCLHVAVAGVVVGGGSAVATAVAKAEPSAADSTTSTGASPGDAGRTDSPPTRSRARAGRPAAAAAAAVDSGMAGNGRSPLAAPRKNERQRESVRIKSAGATVALPTAEAQRRPAAPAPLEPVPTAADTDSQSAGPTGVAGDAAAPTAVAVAAALPVAAGPLIAVPAPAAPAPVPVPPLLPTGPALPVSPASASTVSGSATTTRRSAASVSTAQRADAPPTHVLLIGIDGTNLSKILADPGNVGFFDMMDQSVTAASSIVGHATLSGPAWSSILTGAWDSKTGVINNIFNPEPYTSWPSVFSLLKAHDSDIETTVVSSWDYLNGIAEAGAYSVDNSYYIPPIAGDTDQRETDALVAQRTVELIDATDPAVSSFLFSYNYGVDEVGHLYGGNSPEYAAAVRRASENLGLIMDAVQQWETATGEDWSVIAITDHGHQPQVGFGHGFQSPVETSTFIIANFAGGAADDGKQNLAYSTIDTTPTILSLFGAPLRSDFDGVPIQSDPVVLNSTVVPDDLKQSLNSAIASYGYPDIITNIALGTRTVFGAIPYFLDIFVSDITAQLQSVVDQDIFLISALAGLTELAVQFTGGLLVGVTQAIARVVGYLTGAGVIAPTDPPLPAPPAAVLPDVAVLA